MTKISTCLFLFILSFTIIVNAQTTAEKITHIRQQVAAINADKSYKKIVLENEAFPDAATDGGMEVTGYFKGDKLVRLAESVFISNGNFITEYYLDGDSLIFVYRQFQMFAYSDSAGLNYTNMGDVVFEGRYYFDGVVLIDKQINGDKGREGNTADLMEQKKKYAAMLYKKKRSGK